MSKVEAHKDATGSVIDLPSAKPLEPREVLEVPCHILVPAALENQITLENAERIQTRLVVEAANGPVTPGADEVLAARGIEVLPDILANAGGVVVSYFEWVQNLYNQQWDEPQVQEKLRRKMYRATEHVVREHAILSEELPRFQAQWGTVRPTVGMPVSGWRSMGRPSSRARVTSPVCRSTPSPRPPWCRLALPSDASVGTRTMASTGWRSTTMTRMSLRPRG